MIFSRKIHGIQKALVNLSNTLLLSLLPRIFYSMQIRLNGKIWKSNEKLTHHSADKVFLHKSICLSNSPSICCSSVRWTDLQSIRPSIRLSICPSVRLSICQSPRQSHIQIHWKLQQALKHPNVLMTLRIWTEHLLCHLILELFFYPKHPYFATVTGVLVQDMAPVHTSLLASDICRYMPGKTRENGN